MEGAVASTALTETLFVREAPNYKCANCGAWVVVNKFLCLTACTLCLLLCFVLCIAFGRG